MTTLTNCRICGSSQLEEVIHFGDSIALTGVFPKKDEEVLRGPLTLVKCSICHLVQLAQTYPLESMYGDGYGYRSGLNAAMKDHLFNTAYYLYKEALSWPPIKNFTVLDIGSSDGTLLKMFKHLDVENTFTTIGFDPSGEKFRLYYSNPQELVVDFFTIERFKQHFPDSHPNLVTTISMFYDLPDPMKFARDVYNVLAPEGYWYMEQGYLPLALQQNAYDTLCCHEHLEMYGLNQIYNIASRTGFSIIDVGFNTVNGGSFTVLLKKSDHPKIPDHKIFGFLATEKEVFRACEDSTYLDFRTRVAEHRQSLINLLYDLVFKNKKTVMGYGASTKGNALSQLCNLDRYLLAVADVNSLKWGRLMNGVPIISEDAMRESNPDYLLVFPWHFKREFITREKAYLENGGTLILPLPRITLVTKYGEKVL